MPIHTSSPNGITDSTIIPMNMDSMGNRDTVRVAVIGSSAPGVAFGTSTMIDSTTGRVVIVTLDSGGTPTNVVYLDNNTPYTGAMSNLVTQMPPATAYPEVLVATQNQTVFTLSNLPLASRLVEARLVVNQAITDYGVEYSVAGTTLTWNPTIAGYNLWPDDIIIFTYFI